jgi:hypothetical protein
VSAAFTIVPKLLFDGLVDDDALRATIRKPTPQGDLELYFAGDIEVRALARTDGLMCVRILSDTGVIHVDTEGYEGGLDDLENFVRRVLHRAGPCRVFDDETGEELSHVEARDLLGAPREFVED